MKAEGRPTPLTDGLRRAIRDSRLSFNELARLAGVGQPQISRFMAGERDLTLAVASRVCQVLGLSLVHAGPALTEPLERPERTTRQRRVEGAAAPPFAEVRGRGRRVDLLPGGDAGAEAVDTPPAGARRAGRDGGGERGRRKKG